MVRLQFFFTIRYSEEKKGAMRFFSKKTRTFRPEIWRFESLERLSQAGAAFIRELARIDFRQRRRFSLVLSGGSTPGKLFAQLSGGTMQNALDWERTDLFWSDERCVPPDAAESNFNLARGTLFSRALVPEANVYRMKGELGADGAAADYQRQLEAYCRKTASDFPQFGCALLGFGPDGHTASLFHGTPALDEDTLWAAPVFSPKANPPLDRVTLTYPVLNAARTVLLLASGQGKAAILRELFHDPEAPAKYPVARLNPAGRYVLLADEAALALC